MPTESYQQSTAFLVKNQPKYTKAEALQRVKGPATCLIAVSALFIAAILGSGVYMAAVKTSEMMSSEPPPSTTLEGESPQQKRAREDDEKRRAAERNFITFSLISIVGLICIVCSSVVLAGGLKMRQLKGFKLAYAGAAFATIPILSPLLVLGIPFGIWALITIHDKEIRRYFS